MKLSKWQKFSLWFAPLVIIYLGYTFYLMTLSQIPYALGISHLFNPQKQISITTPDIYQQNNSAVILELKPGEETHARARIMNLTNEDLLIDIFPLDAIDKFKLNEAGYKLESRASRLDEVGKWITLPKEQLSLKKHQEEFIEFGIKIPENVDPSDYAGGIAIEKSNSPDEIIPEGIVKVKKRYAMRVYIKVTDTPNQSIYRTWEQRLAIHNKLFRIHSSIVIINLIILVMLFVAFKPKNN